MFHTNHIIIDKIFDKNHSFFCISSFSKGDTIAENKLK